MIPSPAQTLLLLVLVVAAFVGGTAVGALNDPTEVPPKTEYVEVLAGDFENVPLTMQTTMGTTFRYVCDMHFAAAPADEDTATCDRDEKP